MELAYVFEIITRRETVWIASSLIVAWALCGAVFFSGRLASVRQPLNQHVQRLEASPEGEEFVTALYTLEQEFEQCPVIGHSWHEFSETLIFPEPDDPAPVVRNSISA